MTKKIILSIVAVMLVLVALAGVKALQIGSLIAFGKSYTPPPETVSTAAATEEARAGGSPSRTRSSSRASSSCVA